VRPSTHEIEDLFRAIKIPELEHRLREALRRDASGSVMPDGFPATTGGGFSNDIGRPTENTVMGTFKPARREDPDGPHVQRLPKDPVHQDAENAWAYAQQALASLKAANNRLDHLEHMTGKPASQQLCQSCIRVAVKSPMEHFSNVADRLPTHWRLCQSCYDWIRRHNVGAPPKEWLEKHHMVGDRGRTRVQGKSA
jgi:hypothetical protein